MTYRQRRVIHEYLAAEYEAGQLPGAQEAAAQVASQFGVSRIEAFHLVLGWLAERQETRIRTDRPEGGAA